jgi:integrase
VSLCLLTGMRTEEARALTWEHVDLDDEATYREVMATPRDA